MSEHARASTRPGRVGEGGDAREGRISAGGMPHIASPRVCMRVAQADQGGPVSCCAVLRWRSRRAQRGAMRALPATPAAAQPPTLILIASFRISEKPPWAVSGGRAPPEACPPAGSSIARRGSELVLQHSEAYSGTGGRGTWPGLGWRRSRWCGPVRLSGYLTRTAPHATNDALSPSLVPAVAVVSDRGLGPLLLCLVATPLWTPVSNIRRCSDGTPTSGHTKYALSTWNGPSPSRQAASPLVGSTPLRQRPRHSERRPVPPHSEPFSEVPAPGCKQAPRPSLRTSPLLGPRREPYLPSSHIAHHPK